MEQSSNNTRSLVYRNYDKNGDENLCESILFTCVFQHFMYLCDIDDEQ